MNIFDKSCCMRWTHMERVGFQNRRKLTDHGKGFFQSGDVKFYFTRNVRETLLLSTPVKTVLSIFTDIWENA